MKEIFAIQEKEKRYRRMCYRGREGDPSGKNWTV